MKRIHVIVYTLGNDYRNILEYTNWEISVLIVDNEEWKKCIYEYEGEKKRLNRINKIVTLYDFYYNNDLSYLNKELILANQDTQLKFVRYMYRFSDDMQEINDTYFRTLAYSSKLLANHKCELFLNMNFNHGNCDIVMSNLARNNNILSINIEPMLRNKRCIYNNSINDLVKLNTSRKIDLSESLFYKENVDKDTSEHRQKKYVELIKKSVGALFYILGGWLGEQLLGCIYRKSFYINTMFKKKSWLFFYKSYRKLLRSKAILEGRFSSWDSENKYVFFPLHFEPEATIDGRSLITCQLSIIRMISQALPKGWLCLVKEHPHQFAVNTHMFSSFVHTASRFKTKYFYDELSMIPNVKIVDTSIPSGKLIKNAAAVATMSGTVAAETVPYKKPILVFSSTRTIYRKSERFIIVNSYDDCKNALFDVDNNDFTYRDDFQDICNQYLFDISMNEFKLALNTIESEVYRNTI